LNADASETDGFKIEQVLHGGGEERASNCIGNKSLLKQILFWFKLGEVSQAEIRY
jgi:hypothetical protein